MGQKISYIFFNATPVLVMVGLVPLVRDEYVLTIIYIGIIIGSLIWKRTRNDLPVFLFGLVIMTFFEYLFIRTGVEVFEERSLFGAMPLWLPFLWGYGFVAIKRALRVL